MVHSQRGVHYSTKSVSTRPCIFLHWCSQRWVCSSKLSPSWCVGLIKLKEKLWIYWFLTHIIKWYCLPVITDFLELDMLIKIYFILYYCINYCNTSSQWNDIVMKCRGWHQFNKLQNFNKKSETYKWSSLIVACVFWLN